jgi:hypothetical protein
MPARLFPLRPQPDLNQAADGLSQSKSGLTSAPFLPQAWQTNCGSISDNLISSDHRAQASALSRVQWPHL